MAVSVLLISVGGSPDGIIYSIKSNNPDKIIFAASADTRPLIFDNILPALIAENKKFIDHEIIIIPCINDVGEITFHLLNEVPKKIYSLGIKDLRWPQIVDYTAGTKAMSSAVVWASSQYPCSLCYIDSPKEGRTKDGVGTVISGKEMKKLVENPWNKIAYFEIQKMKILVNRLQYEEALRVISGILVLVSEARLKRILEKLSEVIRGFSLWDWFDHKGAKVALGKNLQILTDMNAEMEYFIPGLVKFTEEAGVCFKTLSDLRENVLTRELVFDLVANALRRGDIETKFDDACARFYAATEKLAKHELKTKYGIDTSNALPELLPDSLREEYKRKYRTVHEGKEEIKFGLQPAYELLFALNDDLGRRFRGVQSELNKVLKYRNDSILAHGHSPINGDKYLHFKTLVFELLNLREEDIVRFPMF